MNKRIAINLLQFSHKNATGSFIYIKNLLDNLLPLDRGNSYFLLLPYNSRTYFKKRYAKYKNVSFKVVDFRYDALINPARAFLKLWVRIKKDRRRAEMILQREIQGFLAKNAIRIYFSPAGSIYPRGLTGVKIISTIFDLQPEYLPNQFSDSYRERRNIESQYAAEKSDHIIAISDFTKRSIVEKYGTDPDKITTTLMAPQKLEEGECRLVLPDNFIFYPAAFWPHKNHEVLIRAFNEIKEQFNNLCLVFTGVVKNQELLKSLVVLTESLGLEKRVLFLGHVSDSELECIYKKAKLLVFASSFEGFGIPLVEAFNYSLPVIAAENTSIREVVEDACILIPTGDIGKLSESIVRVLTDDELRRDLVRRGLERAKNFSWEKTAWETLAIFNSL